MEAYSVAHEYSVQIHEWISQKIDTVRKDMKPLETGNDQNRKNYLAGRFQELQDIRQYLTDKIDLDTQEYYH
jgi:hypothetical protein